MKNSVYAFSWFDPVENFKPIIRMPICAATRLPGTIDMYLPYVVVTSAHVTELSVPTETTHILHYRAVSMTAVNGK